MPAPNPEPLLRALGEHAAPHTAREWAHMAMRAQQLRDTGLVGSLTPAPTCTGSRLFGPLMVDSHLDPAHWATLAALDLTDIAARKPTHTGLFAHLPTRGWLHIALPRATGAAGYGDVRVCWINQPAPATHPDTGYGFSWADEPQAQAGLSITWAPATSPKPAAWVGFQEARTAVWRLGLDGDDTLDDEEEDAFYTAVEDAAAPIPEVSLGMEPCWAQESPASNDARFLDYPPLLAIHSSHHVQIADAGTLAIHADLRGEDPEAWASVWAIDSL